MSATMSGSLGSVRAWLVLACLTAGLSSLAMAQAEAGSPPPPPGPPPHAWMSGPDQSGNMMYGPGPMGGMHSEIGEGKPVKGAPMSGDLVVTRDTTLANGTHIHTVSQTKIYRDSEGRVRREIGMELNTPTTGSVKHTMIVITDPVAGYRYLLNPDNKTARQMAMHGPKGGGDAHPPRPFAANARDASDLKTEPLGTKTIDGLQAEGSRVTHTIPAGAIGNDKPIEVVTERWTSTELQVPLLVTHSDPMMGAVTTTLTNISGRSRTHAFPGDRRL